MDYALGYNGFGSKVSNYPAGQRENYKLEIMIRQLINYEAPELADVFVEYFARALVKLMPEKDAKFFTNDEGGEKLHQETVRVFYPELLSAGSLNLVKKLLERVDT